MPAGNTDITVSAYSDDAFNQAILVDHARGVLENKQVLYLHRYLRELSAKTVIAESSYLDRAYLEDYVGYYVRCFNPPERNCRRLHFFSTAISQEQLDTFLGDHAASSFTEEILQKNYLGFVVLRPLPETIIGRTCLKTYESKPGRQITCVRTCTAHLFGIKFTFESLPFQEQDRVTAACATSALWSALHCADAQPTHAVITPIEITRAAFARPPLRASRALPNTGLTFEEMAVAIRHVGLEPLAIPLLEDEHWAKANLYAYLKAGLPGVLGIDFYTDERHDRTNDDHKNRHAVTATGFSLADQTHATPSALVANIGSAPQLQLTSDRINKLYIHDDGIGPFARANVVSWPWGEEGILDGDDKRPSFVLDIDGYERHEVAVPDILLLPIYHKIRMPFQPIYFTAQLVDGTVRLAIELFERIKPMLVQGLTGKTISWDIHLITASDYKSELSKSDAAPAEKLRVLKRNLPRFLWLATLETGIGKGLDFIFDATGIEQEDLLMDCISRSQTGNALLEVFQEWWTVLPEIPEGSSVDEDTKRVLETILADR